MTKLSSFSDRTEVFDPEATSRKRRRLILGVLALTGLTFAIAAEGMFRASRGGPATSPRVAPNEGDEFRPLGSQAEASDTPSPASARESLTDPIVVPGCRLAVIHKQDVPSQREGVLFWVGTEVGEAEPVDEDRLLILNCAGKTRRIRLWKEGDVIQAGQLLAQMDDRLALEDVRIRTAKVLAAKADLASAQKVAEEAANKYETQERLRKNGRATSAEEVRAAKLAMERARYDAVSKEQGVALAESERHQAETVVALHQVRSSIPGIIKTVYRRAGESIKNLEPVVQVWSLDRIRVEGQVDVQYLPRLRPGMEGVLEPTYSESPRQTLVGHLQEVTSVAVSKDRDQPVIVSGSEDGTVRVWDRATGRERRIWQHDIPVKSVSCTPAGSSINRCCSGAADGKGRLWDLDSDSDKPARALAGQHQGAVLATTFSLDGRYCVTGGEDRNIVLWETETGDVRYRFPEGHRAAVTSLQFTPQGQLVSAGRDNTIRLWDVGEQQARQRAVFDRRAGDVMTIGVSPDGKTVLFDQGPSLRLLSMPGGRTQGVLQHTSDGSRFGGIAVYSPDGRMILTTSSSDGIAQLWKPPSSGSRGHLYAQLVTSERLETTCAAFHPSSSFLVTGTKGHQVLVWPVPSVRDTEERIRAKITLVEQALDTSTRQVRVRAELRNTSGRLLPGATVTLSVYPR